jgi:eukaryotic-like serine/threonine-protein kinase
MITARASHTDTLVERLAEEMDQCWQRGERPLAEDFFARFPQLWEQPEAATELIYEEICLRQEYGQATAEAEVLGRFPQWQQQLRAILDCHQLLEGTTVAPRFPEPGTTFGEFRLLAELGRGAQGRVFLATQPALAERAVVLKLTAQNGHEHLSLARLQHTHIVALYAVHDFPTYGLRALCLPYFGGAVLARLLEIVRNQPLKTCTGRHLLEALRQVQNGAPVYLPVEGAACNFLSQASYVEAVCWIGACLADALSYAHERGLIHLDLKPSNVLLAADGQPMLLDFHLARGPIAAGAAAPAWLGGTPAYMPPEQTAALVAVREGKCVPASVDGRADLYALGVLLCEALGDGLPDQHNPRLWLRKQNSRVSVGLADILGKCLARAPEVRYRDGALLAADLRRHLSDLPLRGVANRSFRESWRKWRRRRPHALTIGVLLMAVLAAGGLALVHFSQDTNKASAALEEGRVHFRNQRFDQAADAWRHGLERAEGLPFASKLAEDLRGHVRLAERMEAAQELRVYVERVRALFGADRLNSAQAKAVEVHCQAFWDKRGMIMERLGALTDAELAQLRTDLLDLAVLWMNLREHLTSAEGLPAVHCEALEVLTEAEALFGPSCVLYRQRQTHAEALGLTEIAEKASRRFAAMAPRSAWDHFALGRAYFLAGDLDQAAAHFDSALALRPQDFWPNFFRGKCAYARQSHDDAVIAFTACVVLAPQSAWCYSNRGQAYAALGRSDMAMHDFDRALTLDPTLASAALNRGMLHYREKRYADALADIQLALSRGADPAQAHYDLALVHMAQQNPVAAVDDLVQVLRHDPGHMEARALRDSLHRQVTVPKS